MSGGSFNYLWTKEASDLLCSQEDMKDMIKCLSKLSYAKDATKESKKMLLKIQETSKQLEVMLEKIKPVWRAMEYWKSLDTDEDIFKEEIEEWKKNNSK